MVKLELSVPSSLESIELRQYQKYMGVVESNEDVENAEDFLNMKLVEIFCDVSLKDVSSIELQDFEKITDIIGKAFAEKTPLIRHFKLGDTEFGFVPNLDKISIGEYIDIEANIVDWKTAHKAMAVLFRPITKKRDEKYQIEEYEGSTVYSDALRYMPLNIAMGAMVFFLSFRQRFIESYPESFRGGQEGELDYSTGASFGKKWGWYQSIYKLAGGDATKINQATKIDVHEAMMFLIFDREKNELENKLIKSKFK